MFSQAGFHLAGPKLIYDKPGCQNSNLLEGNGGNTWLSKTVIVWQVSYPMRNRDCYSCPEVGRYLSGASVS